MKKKFSVQQLQTKNFFENKANNWSIEAKFKPKKIQNTGHARSEFVMNLIDKKKFKYHLDVGCGTGDLAFHTSKLTKKSVGIDFSKNMIKIAKNNYKRKNLFFECVSAFDFMSDNKFDIISANGFIEYISIFQIKNFLKLCRNHLISNGLVILSVRNRLFNLFSLNEFSEKELKEKTFKKFYKESINLNKLNLKKFLKSEKIKFDDSSFSQPKTGNYKIDKRLQFSPLQMVNILQRYNFKTLEIFPINYHPFTPKAFLTKPRYFNLDYITQDYNRLSLIPFSSTFMIVAKKR